MPTVVDMGRKPNSKADRHKPRRMVAVREQYHEPGDELAKKLGCSDLTELVNIAVRELLEKHSLWPPPKDPIESR